MFEALTGYSLPIIVTPVYTAPRKKSESCTNQILNKVPKYDLYKLSTCLFRTQKLVPGRF